MLTLQPRIIATEAELAALLAELLTQPVVAVDTESNSLYAYREQVCLIQFSTPTADYIVDPLAGLDLRPLEQLFANPCIEKVFHAAEYDIMCMKRDFGFHFVNLFDTMRAARILGWRRVGLGDVLNELFGICVNKCYQRYNWGRRPLSPQALHYACLDTHYLLPLRHIQVETLQQLGRWDKAREAFAHVAEVRPAPYNTSGPRGFWRIPGIYNLSELEQDVLWKLYCWRDQEARRLNWPPFKVLGAHTLVALAQARPRTVAELSQVPGLKPRHIRQYGEQILCAIRAGEQPEAS